MSRANCKGVVAASLDEVKAKAADKFGKHDMPNIHLDSDGTEIDDEDYFQTLDPNTELVAVFSGEQWTDVSVLFFFCQHQHFHELFLLSACNIEQKRISYAIFVHSMGEHRMQIFDRNDTHGYGFVVCWLKI